MPSSSPKTAPMTSVISSAPTLPLAASRSVRAVKPETSTNSRVPSRRRWTASGESVQPVERQPRDKGRKLLRCVRPPWVCGAQLRFRCSL